MDWVTSNVPVGVVEAGQTWGERLSQNTTTVVPHNNGVGASVRVPAPSWVVVWLWAQRCGPMQCRLCPLYPGFWITAQ